jgi:hypothetical protein
MYVLCALVGVLDVICWVLSPKGWYTVQTEATFGKSARGKKCERAASLAQKIKTPKNIGDLSERVASIESLSLYELAGTSSS